MSCAPWLAQLDRLADGELLSSEAAALAAHLRTCGRCTAEAVARFAMKRAVRAAGRAYAPSAELRERLLATEPDVYYLTEHYVGYPSILVRLSRVSRDSLRDLLASAALELGEKKRKGKGSRK